MIGCTRCGKCCTEMLMRLPFPAHLTAEEHMRARSDAERFYQLHGFEVLPSMAGEIVLRVPATCQRLITDSFGDGKAACEIYENRPEVCRSFECQKCRGA